MEDHSGFGPAREGLKAVVKWFNSSKGFGFLRLLDDDSDAFLHISVLERIGRSDLPEGAEVVCSVVEGRKGYQVHEIQSVDAPAPSEESAVSTTGVVKFYNADKGYGFIVPEEGGQDIFISARVLERNQISPLQPEQRVSVTAKPGPKGMMAVDLSLAD